MAKKDIRENDIFQVYESKGNIRIGWIFPVIALDSIEHDYSDDEYFRKHAYIGVNNALLYKPDKSSFINELSKTQFSYKFSDIFHESVVLLVISKTSLNENTQFDIDRASASLVSYGYILLNNNNPEDIKFVASAPENRKLRINLISPDISEYKVISDLLNIHFAFEAKPVFKFFFLYQVIELLIELVFLAEQDELMSSVTETFGNPSKTKLELRKMNEFLSEGNRIKLLISKYSRIEAKLNELKIICKDLLDNLNVADEKQETFNKYFYQIRNYIVHQFRNFPPEANNKLEEVVNEFVYVLPSLLNEYHEHDKRVASPIVVQKFSIKRWLVEKLIISLKKISKN